MHESEMTKEQIEAAKLRDKYTEKTISPLKRAKALDKLVTAKARAAAIVVGCIGAAMFTSGIAGMLTWHTALLPYAIAVASIGGFLCGCSPIAHRIVKQTESRKVAAEILELTKDI